MKLKQHMNNFLQDFLNKEKIEFRDWNINVNNQEGYGDYSSNIALKLAKILKKSPIEIAKKNCWSSKYNKKYFYHKRI